MTDDSRVTKLNKHFEQVIRGSLVLKPNTGRLFLESVCAQPDPVTCVNKLIASKKGLDGVQASMRFDLTASFFNGDATALLKYIQAPEIPTVGSGSFLQQVVRCIVEPPIFWNAFKQAFQAGSLQEGAQQCFAWLLLQLISLPGDAAAEHREIAANVVDAIVSSSELDTRAIGQKIKHILSTYSVGDKVETDYSPGGRHDNDLVDFREIAILPTADEIMSKEDPFIRRSSVVYNPDTEDTRMAVYLDNHFRLLRDDMLYEMKEELHIALQLKKGRYRGFIIDGLKMLDLHCVQRCKWGIRFQCLHDFKQLQKIKVEKRKDYFMNDNQKLLRHRSMTCLIVDGEVVAFPTVNRDAEFLAKKPPVVILQFEGAASTNKALLKLKTANHIKLLSIDTAVFSFEPILQALQETIRIPLSQELLFWKDGNSLGGPSSLPKGVVEALRANPKHDLQSLLGTSKSIVLDDSQAASFLAGLTQNLSLIQGPPGTGKSFIGALLAKSIHDSTTQTILVVCYTNHALDQFLEDLLDIGIPSTNIVRLGGKSTQRTEPLSLYKQPKVLNRGRAGWTEIDELKTASSILTDGLDKAYARYNAANPQNNEILEYLEFEADEYFEAFTVPESNDGMSRVGRKGRTVSPDYLLSQWCRGEGPGIFRDAPNVLQASQIWEMPRDSRQKLFRKWKEDLFKETVEGVYRFAKQYNDCYDSLERKFNEYVAEILRKKRIIGCTTTAAAKYRGDIKVAHPDVLLVEEAGEILESHVLTALGDTVKQLILIGDHQQLRPKVNNYKLTVEKGEGYDLNQSLFERLVLNGYPHTTLSQQHRMRPEISALIRDLTYHDLVDAPSTKNRPNLRGVRDNIVFIHHEKPEDAVTELADRGEMSAMSSKQNQHEVQMVLKILKYLGQQGYGTDKIVILTPYLGQLRELREALKSDNDPVLNDLDSYDLVRAGLLSPAAANVSKKAIRLATVDNYQGEESDIVILSMTRSNPSGDIGFMCSSERLNVLLSRARDALIMIGNAHTFQNARKGQELWSKFFNLLKRGGHIYDGLPVKCERHPTRTALLKSTADFDHDCPDGGCKEPCGAMLNCNVHKCPSKCHQIFDHSKISCEFIFYSNCAKGHAQQWQCHKGPPVTCVKCDKEAKATEKKKQEDFILQEKRDAEQRSHEQKLAALEAKIASERQALRDAQITKERDDAILQKQKDLEAAAALVASQSAASQQAKDVQPQFVKQPSSPVPPLSKSGSKASSVDKPSLPNQSKAETTQLKNVQTTRSPTPPPPPKSAAREDWQRQKDVEGATNDAIDAIMEMTGLEEVKNQVLKIKAKIDLSTRQNTSLKDERFNIVLLGNPGTGKTTVARHYAKFLTSVQVLPGNHFVEKSGSSLASDGVPGAKKLIEEVINAGGGAVFVDEAYQLTSNFGGDQVLDFLLAEMENQVGKIVFILAGYSKEMEKFFQHNPGLPSRVPYQLRFDDYKDEELLSMLEKLIEKKFNGKMKVEDGIRGLFGRIAVRRLGRGRGTPGFGNARAMQIMFTKIHERQAARVNKERKDGLNPDDLLLVKEDLIGPDPSKVMVESAAWKKLQSLIGLTAVKQSVSNLFDLIEANYLRELQEKKPTAVSLNRVFLGSPGTGKTTVGKLYGQILADLGMISNGEVVVKNPSDFVGSALGESEKNTKAILATTIGKVLIIDEAYMLYGGNASSGGSGNSDPYKTAVVDTIVAEVQSVPGEDRCVLLLGYKDQMEEMFQNVNPGLARRFAIEDAFNFDDFTDAELLQVLDWKLKDQDLSATDGAKTVAIEILGRSRNRPNFGNAGEVENLLRKAKENYLKRQSSLPKFQRPLDTVFEPQDFDPEFKRGEQATNNLEKLFEDVIGCEEIVEKLKGYQQVARNAKARKLDAGDLIPTTFVFKGPPGTGKTTTARKMGQVYYDMGFLSSTEVVECSASDLVGQFVGQTGPKTKKIFEKALGRVLFVDEAYRLGEGHFAKEAMDELVGILTQDKFKSKIVVILAGYDQEMNSLMAVNTGLSSRFPNEVIFRNMSPDHCLQVLEKDLRKKGISPGELVDHSSNAYQKMVELIAELSALPSWGNARDVITLSKQMMGRVFRTTSDDSGSELTLNSKDALECTTEMLVDRRERSTNIPSKSGPAMFNDVQKLFNDVPPPTPPSISTKQVTKTSAPEVARGQKGDGRDPGVTDEVWRQLQADKLKADRANKQAEEALRLLEENLREAERIQEETDRALAKLLSEARAKDEAEQNELRRRREEARIREVEARAERARIAAALEAKRQEEIRRQKEEAAVQAKLQHMGVCSAGYRWIKQTQGYRCAGGSHFIGNEALGI